MYSGEGSLKGSELGFYIARKNGRGMSFRYRLSLFLPALLVLLVSFTLNFSQIFILSMSKGIEKILIYLGSGDIRVEGHFDEDLDGSVYYAKESGALAFSDSGSAPLYLKAVDFNSYFNEDRGNLLNLEMAESGDLLNPIVISEKIADTLGISLYDRFTVLVYEEELSRTRPYLVTVSGFYDSGYMEFDSTLSYVPFSMIDAKEHSEIILNDSEDAERVLGTITSSGYIAMDYKTLYKGIYDNLVLSVSVLFGVFIILVILASFFASNISFEYIERDKKDIALLFLSGMDIASIKRLYVRLTMRIVVFAAILGIVLSVLFSFFTPSILSSLSRHGFSALNAYLTSFEIIIPFKGIIGINAFLLLCSYLTLFISLKSLSRDDLIKLFSAE